MHFAAHPSATIASTRLLSHDQWDFNFVDDMPLLNNTQTPAHPLVQQRGFALIGLLLLTLILIAAVGLGLYMIKLDRVVKEKFEGKRWKSLLASMQGHWNCTRVQPSVATHLKTN